MYLEEIEVRNWRGIAHQRLKLEPGLNIIHGPNESGKSSLRQAIRAAFLQNPTSKTKEAMAVRSWGVNSAPSVRVDFSLDGERWSVEKLFFSPKGSRLSRNGIIQASDGDVHKRLEILLANSVWLGSLWSEQGDTSIAEVPRALRGKLVAEEVVSPGLLWLEDQLKARESGFWTPQGRPKKSLQDARGKVLEADEAADDLAQEIAETNRISEAIAELHENLQQARGQETELSEQLADLHQKVGAWDRHRAAFAEWNTKVAAVLHEAQWVQGWERCANQVVIKWKELQAYRTKLSSAEAQKVQEPPREPVDTAKARAEYVSRLQQKHVHEKLQKLNPATPKQLATLRQLENDLARADAALESVSMKLSLTALSAIKPSVQIDERDRTSETLSTGETRKWEVQGQAKLVLPGVAELSLEGGASDAANLAVKRDKSRNELARLLEQLNCQTAELAQQRADEARSLEGLVDGKPPTDAVLARLAENAGDISRYAKWTPEKLRDEARTLRGDADELEAQWSQAQRAYQKHRLEGETLARSNPEPALALHLEQLQTEAAKYPEGKGAPKVLKVEELTDAWISKLEDGSLIKTLRAKLETQQAKLEREKSGLRVPEGDEVTNEAIEGLQAQQQSLAQRREGLVSRLNQDLGRLRERSGQYQRLVQLKEQHAALQAETAQSELQAAAIQRLCKSFQEARAELQNDMVGPLQQRVALRLSRITNGRYRGLKLDDVLRPSSVIPHEIDEAELTDLSFGTREQLLFLTRLCLAEMLSEKHQRQSLIFDDNLVHTDGVRMAVALDMLAEVAQTSQLLILTCHPERYSSRDGFNRLSMS